MSANGSSERGQATVALVGVVLVAALVAVGIAIMGQAMVHRSHARNAADAVALAAATDLAAADDLESWYERRGVVVERDGERTLAHSGPSQAAAWAARAPVDAQPAPALVAIMARAEQLLGRPFSTTSWRTMMVTMDVHEAHDLRRVALELGLCERASAASGPARISFELC